MAAKEICTLLLAFSIRVIVSWPCFHCKTPQGVLTNCTGKGLTRVPRNLTRETNFLYLSKNNITTIEDDDFTEIDNLLELYLHENRIEAIKANAFRGLRNLSLLDLSHNKLLYSDDCLYPKIFVPLASLSGLYLHNNIVDQKSVYPDKAVEKCRNLQFLKMDGVYAQQFGPGFKKLTRLTSLILSCTAEPNRTIGILRNNSFINLVPLQNLTISNCQLKYIDSESFSPLRNLLYLDVSHNIPGGLNLLRNISYGLQNTTLIYLNMSCMVEPRSISRSIKIRDIEFLQNTRIKEIDASGNNIEIVESGAIRYLPDTLEELDVSDNRFILADYVFQVNFLKNIKVFKANKLNFYHSDTLFKSSRYISKTGTRGVEAVNRSNEDKDLCQEEAKLSPPPRLEYISSQTSGINVAIPAMALTNNSITRLDLRKNLLHTWVGPLCLENLKYLDLSLNYCDNVSEQFFMGMPELEILKIGGNFIGGVLENDKNGNIFKPLKLLKILDLHRNRIYELPERCFQGLENLEVLNVSDNGLETWKVDISHMRNLSFIDISDNYLTTLPKDLRTNLSELIKHKNVSINLYDNNIECSCANLEFLEWFESSGINFVDLSNYTCLSSDRRNIPMDDLKGLIHELRRKCSSYSLLIIASSILLVLFLCLFFCALIYRYRWKLRYLYYMTWGRYSLIKELKDKHYTYDAFVSYASENEDFVKESLLPSLEENFGLRICIHDRDFTPGREIAANIVKAIQNSRKIVFLLSRAFLESYWCMFEFNMTRMERMYLRESGEIMFVIMLESFYNQNLPVEILDLIQSESYLEYPNDLQGNILFWEKLKQTILS